MLFNNARKFDFPPELTFDDGTPLEVISEVKLVGIILSNNLKWQKNTEYITKKAMKKMWILRRLKKMNMSTPFIIDVYIKEVRSTLEQAVPISNAGLTKEQVKTIERVKKTAPFIILDKNYVNYEGACDTVNLEPLDVRREKICLNFAMKNVKSSDSLFSIVKQRSNARNKKVTVKEFKCRTKRFQNSSLPYLAKLLNSNT